MKIWMEGYQITGNESGAQILGEGEGETLEEAILDFKKNNPDLKSWTKREDGSWKYYGCCLFDNEADARVSFG